jgi:putative SOS response-associated peptidase YedK
MCFTIEVHLSRKAIENRFSVDTSALHDFDFNYFYRAFSNPLIPVIHPGDPGSAVLMRWGLIPSWTRDRVHAEQIRKATYNARGETLHEKASFRGPLREGRCLVLAHGYFEWQHARGARIPWYIRLKSDAPFAFAGLADSWTDQESGEVHQTCSIVTTRANPLMEKIHNSQKRMPVILPPGMEKEWIGGEISPRKMKQLLIPFDEREMHAHAISPAISRGDADPGDPSTIAPYNYPDPGTLF